MTSYINLKTSLKIPLHEPDFITFDYVIYLAADWFEYIIVLDIRIYDFTEQRNNIHRSAEEKLVDLLLSDSDNDYQ